MFKNMKVFVAGFLSCLLIGTSALVVAASADLTDIKAQIANTVKFKLYGKNYTPKYADGTLVKPILYKGKYYLPAGMIAEALATPVEMETKTKTIWLGGITRTVAVDDKTVYENKMNTLVTTDKELLTGSDTAYKWGIVNEKIMKNGNTYSCYLKPNAGFQKFATSISLDPDIKKELIVEFRKNDKTGEVIKSISMQPGETKDLEMAIGGVKTICVYAFVETPHGQLTRLILGEPEFNNDQVK